MTLTQIINIVLTLLFPVTTGLAFWLFHFLVERQAVHQRQTLAQFAQWAVRSAEQQNKESAEKKVIATALVVTLFESFKLPVPPRNAITVAIEAEVFTLHHQEARVPTG